MRVRLGGWGAIGGVAPVHASAAGPDCNSRYLFALEKLMNSSTYRKRTINYDRTYHSPHDALRSDNVRGAIYMPGECFIA